MPPKNRKQPRAQAQQTKRKNKGTAKGGTSLGEITNMMAKLSTPKSQTTDLGRMLLHGGNMLGGLVGLPKIFGSGSYALEQNSLWNAGQQVPSMHSENETITLRHREYIADVSIAGVVYASTVYAINPGLPATFPFLSTIAQNFQEYSFKGLVFEYKSTSADSLATGTNTAMGSVLLAVQYRADAPTLSSKTALLNEMWSADSKPSNDALMPVECAPDENPFKIQYVRGAGAIAGDIKMYDIGNLTVATAGGQAGQTNVVGELWASYEVQLRKPQIYQNIGQTNSSAHFRSVSWDATNCLNGFVRFVDTFPTPGCAVAGNVFNIPFGSLGYFLVTAEWRGNAQVIVVPPGIITFNCAVVGTPETNFNIGIQTTNVMFSTFIIQVTNPLLQATVQLTPSAFTPIPSAGVGNAHLMINQIAFTTGWNAQDIGA